MEMYGLTILHHVPGRVRLRCDPALTSFDHVERLVRAHDGIATLTYSPVSRSITVRFDPTCIDVSELVLRIAMAVGVVSGLQPVSIDTTPTRESIDAYGLLSGATIVGAAVGALVGVAAPTARILTTTAGIGTALAIISHAWREYHQRGDFHPETLSVVYLASAFARGAVLPAAAVAWLATFARHVTGTAPERYVVQANHGDSAGHYEVTVKGHRATERGDSLIHFVSSLFTDLVGGSTHSPGSFLDQMRQMSRRHDSMLEGLDGSDRTIKFAIDK
ncbi:MAG: hypothetical protein EA382_05935 [Spirochaetaceae bacterium]|nr:MAG: hypothetical protein EA382_05935 [Spirochaetaceae bacterium]